MHYKILDSGEGKRLEEVGKYRIIRPFSQAIWPRKQSPLFWKDVHAEFLGQLEGGSGKWVRHKEIQNDFFIKIKGVQLQCKLTDFGHIGFFYEQNENWIWLRKKVFPGGLYLNLFGYTGASSLFMAGNSRVTHIDASKSVINWGRENAEKSGIGSDAVRWIAEDARKFVARAKKRKEFYDGIVMDPPTFGRGPKSEVWKIEKDLMRLIFDCKEILSDRANLFLITAHSHGFTHHVLANCLQEVFSKSEIESGEMMLKEEGQAGRVLPSGAFARWLRH